jgi:tellurite resistance protein
MWEALPEISREVEHPEADAWQSAIQQGLTKHGRPLVRIDNLAAIKKFEPRGRLTKKQTEQLITTAFHLRLAIEPDARMLGRNYAWDETVAVFPRRDNTPEDLATYNAASILLRLGINIAAADGQFEEQELLRITSHLSQQFELTATSSERLEHLRFALVHSPATLGTLEKSLQEKLTLAQRQVVGEFLVGVAAADGTISPEELKALKKAWQALGLEQKSLNALLRGPEPLAAESATTVPTTERPIVLNQELIAQIMQDTQRVAEMLRSAMGDEEDEHEADRPIAVQAPLVKPNPIEAVHDNSVVAQAEISVPKETETQHERHGGVPEHQETSPLWAELRPRYHPFLRELLTQPVWDRKQLDQIARSQGLMLGGALEAINELVYEIAGDWLIVEDGDEIQVQSGILNK